MALWFLKHRRTILKRYHQGITAIFIFIEFEIKMKNMVKDKWINVIDKLIIDQNSCGFQSLDNFLLIHVSGMRQQILRTYGSLILFYITYYMYLQFVCMLVHFYPYALCKEMCPFVLFKKCARTVHGVVQCYRFWKEG